MTLKTMRLANAVFGKNLLKIITDNFLKSSGCKIDKKKERERVCV